MRRIHPRSFAVGLVSGLIVFLLVFGIRALVSSPSATQNTVDSLRFQQQGSPTTPTGEQMDPAQRLERMAERFGMTAEELQQELDAGKAIQDIAEEHGVEMRGFPPQGSGSMLEPPRDGSGADLAQPNADAAAVSSY
ncbi:MAG: hypothetical protein WCX61_00010 [Candidatus Peribacteraceae bacterium]